MLKPLTNLTRSFRERQQNLQEGFSRWKRFSEMLRRHNLGMPELAERV